MLGIDDPNEVIVIKGKYLDELLRQLEEKYSEETESENES